jgi:hypothetical protein
MAKARKRRLTSAPASEEMERIGALVAAELASWPGVQVKPLFGMFGAWRNKRIFAALPRTRNLGDDNSVLIKFARLTEPRLVRIAKEERFSWFSFGRDTKWLRFRITDQRDVRDLLVWLAEAAEPT